MKLFRADNYVQNTGNLEGFFVSRNFAERFCDHKIPVKSAEGNFSQITEFECPPAHLIPNEFGMIEKMAATELWENGEIITNYYYH